MDYAIELQQIIDALKQDKTADPKWRNKVVARLEEIQPWMLMFYDTPDFSAPEPLPSIDLKGQSVNIIPAITLDNIPSALREFADPNRLQPPQVP